MPTTLYLSVYHQLYCLAQAAGAEFVATFLENSLSHGYKPLFAGYTPDEYEVIIAGIRSHPNNTNALHDWPNKSEYELVRNLCVLPVTTDLIFSVSKTTDETTILRPAIAGLITEMSQLVNTDTLEAWCQFYGESPDRFCAAIEAMPVPPEHRRKIAELLTHIFLTYHGATVTITAHAPRQ